MSETIFAIPAPVPASGEVDRDARIGERPEGPGFVLGPFGSLANAPAEAVADTVLGHNLGARAPEMWATERYRWVCGISVLDRATLHASVSNFWNSGLVRVIITEDGERHWERASLKAKPRRDFNLPPEPVRTAPAEVKDTATEKLKAAELASLDDRIRRIAREELKARGL